VYHKSTHENTYIGWISCNGEILMASYNHARKEFTTSTLRTGWLADDHCTPSIIVRPGGRIMAFWPGHNDQIKARISANPEDISSWQQEQAVVSNGVCDPNVLQLSEEDDRIYVFYRKGGWYDDATFRTSTNGTDWTKPRAWMTGIAGGYVKYCSNDIDKIHFIAEQKHRTEPGDMLNAYYKGGSFYRADGTRVIE
jgi:hypothetical protein